MDSGPKLRTWSVPHFAMGGVVVLAGLTFLLTLAAPDGVIPLADGSPMVIVGGGAFWGAAVAWAHNRLARPPKAKG